jgi:hypothetical protein
MPRELSPEARERLSRLAKQRHAEGKFGGAKFGKLGGRPRGTSRERIAKRVAEAAMEESNARQIVDVFKDAIHPSQPISVRLKGAQAWAEIANQHAKQELREDKEEHQQRTREELLALVAEKLTSGPAAQVLARQIERETEPVIVDAQVIEEDDGDHAEAAA